MKILGIDPGLNSTGIGVIEYKNSGYKFIYNTFIKTNPKDEITVRLSQIYNGVMEVILKHKPDKVAIEQVFVNMNPSSSMKLCFARSAVLCCCGNSALSVVEYAPTTIKKTIVGNGHADKKQIEHMVKVLLNLNSANDNFSEKHDAIDALAIAICHAHHN